VYLTVVDFVRLLFYTLCVCCCGVCVCVCAGGIRWCYNFTPNTDGRHTKRFTGGNLDMMVRVTDRDLLRDDTMSSSSSRQGARGRRLEQLLGGARTIWPWAPRG
jgi:hypothetical protein